jgi:hypothetical protein
MWRIGLGLADAGGRVTQRLRDEPVDPFEVVRSALALPGAGPLQALPQVLGVGRDVAAERMVRAR